MDILKSFIIMEIDLLVLLEMVLKMEMDKYFMEMDLISKESLVMINLMDQLYLDIHLLLSIKVK